MDKKYGTHWHCVIGKGFFVDLSIQAQSLLFMYYQGDYAILIFKSG